MRSHSQSCFRAFRQAFPQRVKRVLIINFAFAQLPERPGATARRYSPSPHRRPHAGQGGLPARRPLHTAEEARRREKPLLPAAVANMCRIGTVPPKACPLKRWSDKSAWCQAQETTAGKVYSLRLRAYLPAGPSSFAGRAQSPSHGYAERLTLPPAPYDHGRFAKERGHPCSARRAQWRSRQIALKGKAHPGFHRVRPGRNTDACDLPPFQIWLRCIQQFPHICPINRREAAAKEGELRARTIPRA